MELAQKLVKQIWWSSDTFSGRDGRAEYFSEEVGKRVRYWFVFFCCFVPSPLFACYHKMLCAVMLFIHISLVDSHLHPLRHDAAEFRCYLGTEFSVTEKFSLEAVAANFRIGTSFSNKSRERLQRRCFERKRLLKYKFSFFYCVVYRSTFIYAFVEERKLNKIINWRTPLRGNLEKCSSLWIYEWRFSDRGKLESDVMLVGETSLYTSEFFSKPLLTDENSFWMWKRRCRP